nr:MAG TPA: hypothetical protein [Caudoviricetes sp.]
MSLSNRNRSNSKAFCHILVDCQVKLTHFYV